MAPKKKKKQVVDPSIYMQKSVPTKKNLEDEKKKKEEEAERERERRAAERRKPWPAYLNGQRTPLDLSWDLTEPGLTTPLSHTLKKPVFNTAGYTVRRTRAFLPHVLPDVRQPVIRRRHVLRD